MNRIAFTFTFLALLFAAKSHALSCCAGYTGAPPGCDDQDCQDRVSAGDPFCATSSWDFQCSEEAKGHEHQGFADPPCDCAEEPTPTPTEIPPMPGVPCDVVTLSSVAVSPQLVNARGGEDAVVLPHTLAASRSAVFLLAFEHQVCKEGDRKNQVCVADDQCPPYSYDGICDRTLVAPAAVAFVLKNDDTRQVIYESSVSDTTSPFVALTLPIGMPPSSVDDRAHLRLGLTWYTHCTSSTRDIVFTARRALAPATPLEITTETPTETPTDTPEPTETPEP